MYCFFFPMIKVCKNLQWMVWDARSGKMSSRGLEHSLLWPVYHIFQPLSLRRSSSCICINDSCFCYFVYFGWKKIGPELQNFRERERERNRKGRSLNLIPTIRRFLNRQRLFKKQCCVLVPGVCNFRYSKNRNCLFLTIF